MRSILSSSCVGRRVLLAVLVEEDHPTLEGGDLLIMGEPLDVVLHVAVASRDEAVVGIVVVVPNMLIDGVQST
jgi:hypothetical protein